MRHKKDNPRLGRPRAHRKALVQSLVRSLFLYDRIQTTLTKAKAAQRMAERLVNRSLKNDLAAKRYAYSHLNDHSLVKVLFDDIRPRFDDRKGGFTRIFILGNRLGDGAQSAVLEMVVKGESKDKDNKKTTVGKKAVLKTKSASESKTKDKKQTKSTKTSNKTETKAKAKTKTAVKNTEKKKAAATKSKKAKAKSD